MNGHDFKLVVKKKPKAHFLSGYKANNKFLYHCKKCDSTIEYDNAVDIHELNKYMSDPLTKFPCMAVKQ